MNRYANLPSLPRVHFRAKANGYFSVCNPKSMATLLEDRIEKVDCKKCLRSLEKAGQDESRRAALIGAEHCITSAGASRFKNSAVITDDAAANPTFEVNSHSLASNLLTISLGDNLECKFFGSKNDRMFAETFVLQNEGGAVFSFRPGTPEEMVEQFKTAFAAGYKFLFY